WSMVAVVKSTLVGPERIAYAIADNRIASKGSFDWSALATKLEQLKIGGIDLSDVGFDVGELDDLSERIRNPFTTVVV
ncbi:hypothetical protein, partial [Streptococcus pneumoniae]|uniref:hypothetical protein n=1 Tax=Streptococcus pneumoniae TaxID=1313 RepID=UPI003F6A509B